MCTHTYSEAHAHSTYGDGWADRQTKLFCFYISSIWIAKKIGFFILENSAIRDEMPPYVAFHQGLHCLPKQYPKCKGLNDIYDTKSMNTQ